MSLHRPGSPSQFCNSSTQFYTLYIIGWEAEYAN